MQQQPHPQQVIKQTVNNVNGVVQKPNPQIQGNQKFQQTQLKPQQPLTEEQKKRLALKKLEEDELNGKKEEIVKEKPILSSDILNDLEKINDDFALEIKAKQIEEERKKKQELGIEDEKKENFDLKPLVDDDKLQDIADLNPDNIGAFLKKNGKEITNIKPNQQINQKENKQTPHINLPKNLFDNFNIDVKLWQELGIDDENIDKIKHRVQIEIKNFIKDNLIPLLESIIK